MESEEERRERKGERKQRNHLIEEDLKRRKDDEKTRSPRHQNGSPSEVGADKRGHNRESPLSREPADRSYERQDRPRRSNEVKRR